MADIERPRVLVDVDGTLTIGAGKHPNDFAPLNTGVRAFLGALKDRGLEIIVFSARSPVDAVKGFFQREGLTQYVDGFTRTKIPSKLMIDDRAVRFRGSFAATLAEIDSFLPWWDRKNEFSCVMAEVPKSISDKVRGISSKIDDKDKVDKDNSNPHITVKYGIHGDDPTSAIRTLQDKQPASVKLGKLSVFEEPKWDVLKIELDSPDLHEWNAAI